MEFYGVELEWKLRWDWVEIWLLKNTCLTVGEDVEPLWLHLLEQWCWYWHFYPSGVGSQEACYTIQSSAKSVFSMLVWKIFHLVGTPRGNSQQKNRDIFSLQTQGVLASSQKLNLCTVSSSIPFILVIFNHVILVILCL